MQTGKNYPSKTTINLAQRDRRPLNLGVTLPTLILLTVAIAAFTKFGVVDRLHAVSAAETQAAQQELLVSQVQEKTAGYEQLLDKYQSDSLRKSASGGGADPMKCLALVETVLLNRSQVSSFTIGPDTINVKLSGVTLNDISAIYQQLMKSELVSGVQVYNASSSQKSEKVTAAMTIALVVDKPAQSGADKGAAA